MLFINVSGELELLIRHFNRQLTHSEKQLAKELADKSNGKYTAEQIEEQMRGMTVTQNGKTEQGTPDTVVGGVPSDTGGTWLHSGTTDDGRPIITQQLAPENLELQAYIVKNTTGTGVPGPIMYEGPFKVPQPASVETRQLSTARCANGDYNCAAGLPLPLTEAEKQRRLNAAADVAENFAQQAGRVGASAAVAVAVPGPHQPLAATVGLAAAFTNFGAEVTEQLLRPDMGKLLTEGGLSIFIDRLSTKFPLAAPAVNEVGEILKTNSYSKSIKETLNNK